MPPGDLNDYKYWRGQAAELRVKANAHNNDFAANALRRIADNYDAIADWAEDRAIHGIDLPLPRAVPKDKSP